MFEKASRLALRFSSPQGSLTTEDLWDLPLTSANKASLDNIAKALNRQIKDATTESFVVKTSKADEELQLKFDIVKHIIEVKLAEREAEKTAATRRAQKEKLLELKAKKQDEKLSSATEEELDAMIAAL
jgi:hypothetical protein